MSIITPDQLGTSNTQLGTSNSNKSNPAKVYADVISGKDKHGYSVSSSKLNADEGWLLKNPNTSMSIFISKDGSALWKAESETKFTQFLDKGSVKIPGIPTIPTSGMDALDQHVPSVAKGSYIPNK